MSVGGIPDSVLANYPAGTPPPGVQPNFFNPPSRAAELIALNTTFLALMWIVLLVRLYAKGRILRNLGWDDYTCAIAAVGSTACSAMELESLRLGFGRHIWDIRAITLLDAGNVRQMNATSLIYPFVVYFAKLSILLLYLRVFGINRPLRLTVYFAIAFFTLFYIAYVGVQIAFLIDCISSASLTSGLCKNEYAVIVFQGAFNVASDIFVFILPIPRIMNLQVTKRQKIGLLAIFLAGLVACGVSIARLVITAATLNRADKLWYAAETSDLTIVEVNLAIIAACMSTLPGFLAHAKTYGLSIFKSLFKKCRSKISKKDPGTSDADGDISVPGKKYEPYIQLKHAANKAAGTGGIHNSDQLPLWGKP